MKVTKDVPSFPKIVMSYDFSLPSVQPLPNQCHCDHPGESGMEVGRPEEIRTKRPMGDFLFNKRPSDILCPTIGRKKDWGRTARAYSATCSPFALQGLGIRRSPIASHQCCHMVEVEIARIFVKIRNYYIKFSKGWAALFPMSDATVCWCVPSHQRERWSVASNLSSSPVKRAPCLLSEKGWSSRRSEQRGEAEERGPPSNIDRGWRGRGGGEWLALAFLLRRGSDSAEREDRANGSEERRIGGEGAFIGKFFPPMPPPPPKPLEAVGIHFSSWYTV